MLRGGSGPCPYRQGLHLLLPTVIYAYGDESGVHQNPVYCAVAGYIGEPEQWESFKPAWDAVLEHHGVVGGFHALEFFGGKKQYRLMDGSIRNSLIDNLAGVIDAHEVYRIGEAVNVDAFLGLPEIQRKYFTGAHVQIAVETVDHPLTISGIVRNVSVGTIGRHAYRQAYRAAIIRFLARALQAMPENCALHVVLGSHNTLAAGVVDFFNNRIRSSDYPDGRSFESVTYVAAHQSPQLQASDLFAYLWRRYLSGFPLDDRGRKTFRTLDSKGHRLTVADGPTFAGEWEVLIHNANNETQLDTRGLLS